MLKNETDKHIKYQLTKTAFLTSNRQLAGLHVPKKRFFSSGSFFFFLLTYAEKKDFNWLKALFSAKVGKKKNRSKQTAKKNRFFATRKPAKSHNTQYNHFTSIPYIQGTSEKVGGILNDAGLKSAMRPVCVIGQILSSPKDPHNPEEKSFVVYQVQCSDSNFVYIGQT